MSVVRTFESKFAFICLALRQIIDICVNVFFSSEIYFILFPLVIQLIPTTEKTRIYLASYIPLCKNCLRRLNQKKFSNDLTNSRVLIKNFTQWIFMIQPKVKKDMKEVEKNSYVHQAQYYPSGNISSIILTRLHSRHCHFFRPNIHQGQLSLTEITKPSRLLNIRATSKSYQNHIQIMSHTNLRVPTKTPTRSQKKKQSQVRRSNKTFHRKCLKLLISIASQKFRASYPFEEVERKNNFFSFLLCFWVY